ncbi:hypothetical protein SD211_11955 [Prevotella intermedia]|uniref:hypothetical protein n=1 Tax=Prevotella intermedia TaxID=28131 RepID=UPI00397E2D12
MSITHQKANEKETFRSPSMTKLLITILKGLYILPHTNFRQNPYNARSPDHSSQSGLQNKKGSYLLSHIALQYHRRNRA